MRLPALEQKLLSLVQDRWGPWANVEVRLGGSTIIIDLPDGSELCLEASQSEGMLPQAYAALERHLELLDHPGIDPLAADGYGYGAPM